MARRPRRIPSRAQAFDDLLSLWEQLSPAQEQMLSEEEGFPPGVREVLSYLGRTPYPVGVVTAAALAASAQDFVLPWTVIESRHVHRWVMNLYVDREADKVYATRLAEGDEGHRTDLRKLFRDDKSFEAFSTGADFTNGLANVSDADFKGRVNEVVTRMKELAGEGEVKCGDCVRLECLPFDDEFLKLVPLAEGTWVDRHWVVLAEACRGSRGGVTCGCRPSTATPWPGSGSTRPGPTGHGPRRPTRPC